MSRLRAENGRSEVTDNVKCNLKTLFEHQNVGKLCPLGDGATEPSAPFSAAYRLLSPSVLVFNPWESWDKKNFIQVHVLYVTCDNTHERIERHEMLKSLRAFPLLLLLIVIKIPLKETYLGSCISASTFPPLTKA